METGERGFRGYLFNTLWLLSEKGARFLVGATVGVIVARHLGPERFGMLTFAASLAWLFNRFAVLGLDAIAVREIAHSPQRRDVVLGSSCVLRLGGATLALLLVFGTVTVLGKSAEVRGMALLISAAGLLQAAQITDAWFYANVLARYATWASMIAVGIASLFKLSLVAVDAPLLLFGAAAAAEISLLPLALVYFYRSSGLKIREWFCTFQEIRTLFRAALPMLLAGLAASIYLRIDEIMIEQMLGSTQLGLYGAAVRISEISYYLPTSLTVSLFPALVEARRDNLRVYHQQVEGLLAVLAWSGICFALVLSITSSPLVHFAFGDAFGAAAPVLAIHAWAGVFVFLGAGMQRWMLAEGFERYLLYRNIAGAFVNILLNFCLLPTMGIQGAAIATLVSYGVAQVGVLALMKPTRPIFILAINAFRPVQAARSALYVLRQSST